jgi:hypothetical protein
MSQEDLAERLDAVERRLDAAFPEPTDGAATVERTVQRLETFAERLADLEAAVEAVEGYVGEIERVDGELEQRADAAIAAAEGTEERVDAVDQRADGLAERLDAIEARSESAPSADDLQALRSEVADLEDRLGADGGGSGVTSRDATRGGGFDGRDEPIRAEEPSFGAGAEPTGSGRDPDRNGHRHCDCGAPEGVGDLGGTAHEEEAAGDAPSRGDWAATDRPPESRPGRAPQPRSQGPGAPDPRPNEPDSRQGALGSRSDALESRPDVSVDRSDTAPSGAPGDDRRAPIGRADGGRPAQRGATGASSGTPKVTGWDETDPTSSSEPPGAARAPAGGHEDQSWASARTETLLDRLRSLL